MKLMRRVLNELHYELRYAMPLWFIWLATNWLPENRITIRLRGLLMSPFFGKCGKNLRLARHVTFLNSSGISIGNNVYIATGCWIDGIGGLVIEDEVEISPFVVITTSSHCFKNDSVAFGGSRGGPVTIGRGSWLASHITVVAGAKVGRGTIVAANAVVTRDLPDNVLAGGVPAKVIGPRVDKVPNIFSRFQIYPHYVEGGMEEKIKASLCILTTVAGSIKAFYKGQIEALNKAGIRTTVICAEDAELQDILPAETDFMPVGFTRVSNVFRDLKVLWQLYRIFSRRKFDIVQYSTLKASLLGSLAALAARVPVRIYILWGLYYTTQRSVKKLVFKAIDKLICRLSTDIVPIAHEMADFVGTEGLAKRSKCEVVLNGSACGVDLQRFDPGKWAEARGRIRDECNISERGIVIGVVGRLTGDKGINELVSAFAEIAEEINNVYLLIVGTQEEKDRLRPDIEDMIRTHPRIRSVGWQNDPIPYYMAMDIFCLPTYREGFGEVNLEAQAMGLPVVSTDVIGPREAVDNGKTGFLVEPESSKALVEPLKRLIGDPELKRNMGRKGRERVERMFNRKDFIKAVVEHRLKLLSRIGN